MSLGNRFVFLRDLLVAGVSIGLGLSMIQVAMVNHGWWFENFIVRQIETSRGRGAARKALGVGGTTMILLGAWTLMAPVIRDGKQDAQAPPSKMSIGKFEAL